MTETPAIGAPDISEGFAKEESKEFIRKKVWEFMSKNRLTNFPGAYERIPNFKGADLAAQKLVDLKEFQDATSVEINPDKPLEDARILVLDSGKELFVPIPKIKDGLFRKIELDKSRDIRKLVSRKGIEDAGKRIDIDANIRIDLLILGSVAVSNDGYRIGKGRGFADLEFGLLREMNALHDNTVIITLVHDCQVFDELPKNLFKKYDVPVDFILTPTRVIEIEKKLPRPEGIFWDVLTEKRVESMDSLKELKKKHESEGRDTTLATVEEHPGPRRYFWYRRFFRRKSKVQTVKQDRENATKTEGQSEPKAEVKSKSSERRSRPFKPRRAKSQEDGKDKESSDNTGPSGDMNENRENVPPPAQKKRKYRKSHKDYSLLVSNIRRGVKVRDLKNALTEKGIRPNNITWRGYKGFCYLHYAKNKKNADKENAEVAVAIDNIIEVIQQLKINPNDKNLNVKVMEPITKIETMNITAV